MSNATMKTPFERALDYTFGNEGGFVNDKYDRGGATKFGITRDDLSRWRQHACSPQDVASMDAGEAKAIYEAWYWKPLCCDQLRNPAVAIAMFDIGVVRGIGVPPKYLQEVCDSYGARLSVDGHMGPKTLAVANSIDPKFLVGGLADKMRSGFLAIVATRPTQVRFLRGWLARAARLRTLV